MRRRVDRRYRVRDPRATPSSCGSPRAQATGGVTARVRPVVTATRARWVRRAAALAARLHLRLAQVAVGDEGGHPRSHRRSLSAWARMLCSAGRPLRGAVQVVGERAEGAVSAEADVAPPQLGRSQVGHPPGHQGEPAGGGVRCGHGDPSKRCPRRGLSVRQVRHRVRRRESCRWPLLGPRPRPRLRRRRRSGTVQYPLRAADARVASSPTSRSHACGELAPLPTTGSRWVQQRDHRMSSRLFARERPMAPSTRTVARPDPRSPPL